MRFLFSREGIRLMYLKIASLCFRLIIVFQLSQSQIREVPWNFTFKNLSPIFGFECSAETPSRGTRRRLPFHVLRISSTFWVRAFVFTLSGVNTLSWSFGDFKWSFLKPDLMNKYIFLFLTFSWVGVDTVDKFLWESKKDFYLLKCQISKIFKCQILLKFAF